MSWLYSVRQECVQVEGVWCDTEPGHEVFIEEMSCDIR